MPETVYTQHLQWGRVCSGEGTKYAGKGLKAAVAAAELSWQGQPEEWLPAIASAPAASIF